MRGECGLSGASRFAGSFKELRRRARGARLVGAGCREALRGPSLAQASRAHRVAHQPRAQQQGHERDARRHRLSLHLALRREQPQEKQESDVRAPVRVALHLREPRTEKEP